MSTPPPPPSPPEPWIPTTPDGLPERPTLVTAIAIVDFVAAAFALFMGSAFALGGMAGGGEEAVFVVVLAGVMAAAAALAVTAGVGLLQRRPWGRTLQIVVSSVGLLACGLGTIVNALILAYMLQRRTALALSGRAVQHMSREERMRLATTPGESSGATGVLIVLGVVVGGVIVIAITGILAAIAIPNFLTAVQRGKQKRTMADIRTVGSALDAYATDNQRYPDASSVDELVPLLTPTYATVLPTQDGWGRPLGYAVSEDSYVLRSSGKDMTFETPNPWDYEVGEISDVTEDIVFANGAFVRLPAPTPLGPPP